MIGDAHLYDDAAYVLGALDPDERAAFERHLAGCADCRARIDELAGLPPALAAVDDPAVISETPPQTLLPGLVRRVAARRRRERWLTGGLAGLAAACVIALVIAVWPSTSGGRETTAAQQPRRFTVLVQQPVAATAVLTAKQWGTEIDVTCVYRASGAERRVPYLMFVYARDSQKSSLGGWKQPGGDDVKYTTGTPLALSQISRIDITLQDGTPILRLTN